MLNAGKHFYGISNSVTIAVEMLFRVQHDVLWF